MNELIHSFCTRNISGICLALFLTLLVISVYVINDCSLRNHGIYSLKSAFVLGKGLLLKATRLTLSLSRKKASKILISLFCFCTVSGFRVQGSPVPPPKTFLQLPLGYFTPPRSDPSYTPHPYPRLKN